MPDPPKKLVRCPGCGVERPHLGPPPDPMYNASGECRHLMNEVTYYTLAHAGRDFIHQHLVDAYGAQHVRESKSNIGAAFALAGLYLAVERGFSGRQVQLMHMKMARRSKQWPRFDAPPSAGAMTIADALAADPGRQRDQVILDWCGSVWDAWKTDQSRVREMVGRFL